jgi:hypothetical protein
VEVLLPIGREQVLRNGLDERKQAVTGIRMGVAGFLATDDS